MLFPCESREITVVSHIFDVYDKVMRRIHMAFALENAERNV